jgi:hypothetical protein
MAIIYFVYKKSVIPTEAILACRESEAEESENVVKISQLRPGLPRLRSK